MNNLAPWNYQESVKQVAVKVRLWKVVELKKTNLTNEICRNLYEARRQLDSRGLNQGNQNVSSGTFSQYLVEVGLARATVHRWLEHFDPEEQRLLSNDEISEKQEQKRIDRINQEKAERLQNKIIAEKVPEKFTEPIPEEKPVEKKINPEPIGFGRLDDTRDEFVIDFTEEEKPSSVDEIRNILGQLNAQEDRKIELHKKIRLTGDNAGHVFNQMLIEYLDNLSSDSERLEACHNGIKIFKNFIRNYQMSSAI